MIPIVAETCERAWLAAAEHLVARSGHTEYNLVVEIAKPADHDDADRRVRRVVDDFLRRHDANPLSTVAGTIFPTAEYVDHGPAGVYDVYPNEVYPEILDSHEWGRYAYRLVRWPAGSDEQINPLKVIVEKISNQLTNGRRMRGCYEMSLTDYAIDLPLYDPITDGNRPRGGPCLSHVSLKLGEEDSLYLTAMYRSHSYVAKALGNFLGLASLQAFICDQTGLTPGPLMCVSTYARLDPDGSWSTGEAVQLVKEARTARGAQVDASA